MKYIEFGDEYDRKILFDSQPWLLDSGVGEIIRIMGYDKEIKGYAFYDGHSGVVKDKKMIMEGGNIFLTVMSLHPMFFLKNTASCILHYPFNVLKCDRVTTLTPISNKKAIRINQAFGFSFEGLMKKIYRYDDIVEDGIIYSIQKEEAISRGYI